MSSTGFYVTVRRDRKHGWLLGPFDTYEAASERVQEGSRLAIEIDPFCAFDAFGVSSITRDAPLPRGVLNHLMTA